jgi:tRNA G18 (ribose-2'-O)-methylase SpoU
MNDSDRKLDILELGRVAAVDYTPRSKVVVVLDDVRSRHNVGSIFRTCDSFGVEAVHLCGLTPCPPHREIEKTALGATASVPWSHHDAVEKCLRSLKEQDYQLIAVEQTLKACALEEWEVTAGGKFALVFGNELHGVSDKALGLCHGSLIIPQFGSKHSLNVSVCAGIVVWWFAGRN